jgi:hypothetical protein
MVGAALLFLGTLLLGIEATIALRAIHGEMDFLWKLGQHHAPKSLRDRAASRRIWPQLYRQALHYHLASRQRPCEGRLE